MTDRDLALSTIQRLPEDVSLEDVTDEIALISALREGIREADEGKKRSQGCLMGTVYSALRLDHEK